MAAQQTVTIEVLEYFVSKSAESGTNTTNIKITDHGLLDDDFIANSSRRAISQKGSERGSRRVTKVDDDNVTVTAVASQTTSDTIRLYRFTDKTEYLSNKGFSMSRRVENSSCNFQLCVNYDDETEELDYEIFEGQYVRITLGDWHQVVGIVENVDKSLISTVDNKVLLSVSVGDLSGIPYRRTITVDYAAGTSTSNIVHDMVDTYLVQEGIRDGTISSGITLDEALTNDSASIGEILDLCAQKNGFYWTINDHFQLNFYQEPSTISDSSYDLVDGDSFTDYRNVRINGTINGYVNKAFFVGGMDENGNQVNHIYGDLDKQNTMQNVCGGSGIYGKVSRDSSNVEMQEYTAGATTTNTNLNITAHPFVVGDFIWNKTRNTYTFVTTIVNANSVTVELVSSQASGDTIVFFYSANLINKNILKRDGFIQRTLTFETHEVFFFPATKLNVSLKKLGIPSSYWNIEEINFNSMDLKYFKNTIKAVLRDTSNFSTQRKRNAIDFFKNY